MRISALFFSFLSLCFLPGRSIGQEAEKWDWAKCIDYAIQNNLQIQQANQNLALSGLLVKQHKLATTPTAFGTYQSSYSFGKSLDPTTYTFVNNQLTISNLFQLNIQQPVFQGLTNLYNIRKSKSDIKALELDKQALIEDIQLSILTAYLNILNAEEQLLQAKEQLNRTEEQSATVNILINSGANAEADMNDINAQLAADEYTIAQVNNQRLLAYQSLISILQLPGDKDIEIVPIDASAVEISSYPMPRVMDVYSEAMTTQPRIKSAEQRLESGSLATKAAKGYYYPTISLYSTIYTNHSNKYQEADGTFSITPIGVLQSDPSEVVITAFPNYTGTSFFNQLGDNFSSSFGLTLNIPIYNRRSAWLAVQQSQVNLSLAALEKKQRDLSLYNDIRQAWLKAQSAIDNYIAANKALEAAARSREYAEDRFNAGSINILQLNLAGSNETAARSRLTQAKYEFLFNTRVLDYYMGKPIEF